MATVRIYVQCILLYNSSTIGCVLLHQTLDDNVTVRLGTLRLYLPAVY
jgi:hypothetical protein